MRRVRFWRLQLLAGLLLAGIVGLVILARVGETTGSLFIRTAVAEVGLLESTSSGSGFMVRSESAVRAPADGIVTLLVEDGQRVRAGQIVAEIRQEESAEVREAVAQIDDQIAALDQKAQAGAESMRRRIEELGSQIRSTEAELASAITAGRDDLAAQHGEALQKLEHQLSQVEAEFAQLRAEKEVARAALLAERQAIFRRASESAVRILADGPGVVSFAFDDFEGRFSTGQAPEELWQVVTAEPAIRRVADGTVVREGEPLFRLIDSFVTHLFVSFEKPPLLNQGEQVWLRWEGEKPPGVRARVDSIHNRLGAVGVWFSLETYQERFGQLRVLPEVTVVTRSVQGVIVPRSAIILRNERTGIYLVAEGSPVFRYITVLAADESRAVVDQVPSGTRIVTNPRRLARDATPF